jgi:hypothetical protein
MLKIYCTLLIIILGSIELISTDCPDKKLSCFNSKKELLGNILVNQCFKWSRFSCIPCSASTDQTVINYNQYIQQCRHYYSTAVEILPWVNIDMAQFILRLRLGG